MIPGKPDRSARVDRWSASVLGVGFLLTALGFAIGDRPVLHGHQTLVLVLLVALYTVAYRTEFVRPLGSTVPTEPLLVAMLFLAPVTLVPVMILIGLLVAGADTALRGRDLRHGILVRLASGWHCIGPVAVLLASGQREPSLRHWPVYCLALLAQFAIDTAIAVIRTAALNDRITDLALPLLWTFAVDCMLAPIGLIAVIATTSPYAGAALAMLPVGLIALLVQDRRELAETQIALDQAILTAQQEARIDPMTSLANRRAWYEALSERDAQQSPRPTVIVVTDINGLKRINDEHGHEAGDQLILAMARVLSDVAPAHAVVSRLGGDEFAVLFDDDAPAAATEFVERLRAAFCSRTHGIDYALSAAIGAHITGPGVGLDEAYRRADLALYADKQAFRARQRHAVS